ncbi:uncharacterized protein SAPINGB_P001301 [Magnusiomyces paraingens]|uniref:Dolichyl-phosphate-mannose--protein mannosyltransferase n=1 Tax=Magnusiomyces paraingens TaxID=2606893 RepID=A0A5E8BB70_9ASCO|nr:uncharacterized protein SAPINGB_P001301 [Saprochaete ingens]VVT46614.1 unnamed protein product [Saprochaete ingens]
MPSAVATGIEPKSLRNRAGHSAIPVATDPPQTPPTSDSEPSLSAGILKNEDDEDGEYDTLLVSKKKPATTTFGKAKSFFKSRSWEEDWYTLEAIFAPILFTGLALFTRLYQIGHSNIVTWDESHFGKFGSFYLKREFYFDLHPPLGKMLVGLSGYIAGYNGSFSFKNGLRYPEDMNFVAMRQFNAMFNVVCIPAIYFTAKKMGFSLPAVWFVTLALLCDTSYVALGKLILLDSMLVCFTFLSMLGLMSFHRCQRKPFTKQWFFWLIFTGFNLGCVVSVKMVGLFMIGVVGVYTVVDLFIKFGDTKMPIKTYLAHWIYRIFALIIIPFLIFTASFKVHFMILTNSGSGESNMSSLFQVHLNGTKIKSSPLDVAYGSEVTIRCQGRGAGLLHSHKSRYPKGSKQQQITTYFARDNNNKWRIEFPRWESVYNKNKTIRYVMDGETIRLNHPSSSKNLHSHNIKAHVTRDHYEVSAYGNNTHGDKKDNWVIEFVENIGDVNKSLVHPITTTFRLRHKEMNCYLAGGHNRYPKWGFTQGEVTCDKNAKKSDTHTWWNIEDHTNARLPIAKDRVYPKTKFFSDFIRLYTAMMRSNNGLVPDPDRYKAIESRAWEWPTLHVGLRLCAWTNSRIRFFLMSHPINTWLSTAGIFIFGITTFIYMIRWQRGYDDLNFAQIEKYAVAGIIPIIGYVFHYMPFVIMARVTYVHHYLPSFYFAILVLGFLVDHLTTTYFKNKYVKTFIYLVLYLETIGIFYHFAPICFGMEGDISKFKYLDWISTWKIGDK